MPNGLLTRFALLWCSLAAGALFAAPASAQCRLCSSAGAPEPTLAPLTVEVDASLDFSRIGLASANQGGTVTIDADTGQRTISGLLVDLGGMPVQGDVTIRGAPNQRVAVDFPTDVVLTSADGATLRLRNFGTSLKNNPRIGSDGTLRFTFGAELSVDGLSDGDFRGSIPITVDYR